MNTIKIPKKRAVSTIIGSFFFIIIMVAAFTAFIAMMNTNNEFFRTQLTVTEQEISKAKEEFIVSACTTTNNRLSVYVENVGVVPVEVADLFVTNKNTHSTDRYDITFDDSFVPIGQRNNILESQTVTLSTTPYTYDIKVVSALGNSETITLPVANPSTPDDRLAIKLSSIPPLIQNNGNATLLMTVYNRGNHTLYNVIPNINPPKVTPTSVTVVNVTQFQPKNITRLDPNESIEFHWAYQLFGGIGTKVDFTTQAKAKLCADTSTYDVISAKNSTRVTINQEAPIGTVGPTEPFAKPKIFISIPSPFGQSNNNDGYWTVTVVNPTNQSLTVKQLSLNVIVPNTDTIFSGITQANSIPTSGWSNPAENVILWSSSTGVEIPPTNVRSWRMALTSTTVTKDTPASVISVNVYTTFGQFANTGKTVAAYLNSNTPIANVFYCKANPAGTNPTGQVCPSTLTSKTASGNARLYNVTSITGGVPMRFNVTVENSGSGSISSNSKLLTIIPAGFLGITDNLALIHETGFNNVVISDIKTFNDGSKVITATLSSALSSGQTATLSFSAIPPVTEERQMYLIFHLLDGTTSVSGSTLGSVSEVVVQVCGTRTGCNG